MNSKRMWKCSWITPLSCLVLAGCGSSGEEGTPTPDVDPTPTATSIPTEPPTPEPTPCAIDSVLIPGESSYPESISVGSDGSLYISGTVSGSVFKAAACTDQAAALGSIPQPYSVVGVRVDEARKLVWACGTDFNGYGNPKLFALDLTSGTVKATHALQLEAGLCNDMVFDAAGNVYVTESFSSQVFRVAAADVLSDTEAPVWLSDPSMLGLPNDFGLNGIAIHDSTLWIVNSSTGKLYQVGIDADGSAGEVAELAVTPALSRPDGIALRDSGELLVIEGPSNNRLMTLTFSGSKQVKEEYLVSPPFT